MTLLEKIAALDEVVKTFDPISLADLHQREIRVRLERIAKIVGNALNL